MELAGWLDGHGDRYGGVRTIHGECSAAEDFAGVAVAKDVGLLVGVEVNGPLVVAAVAFPLEWHVVLRSSWCGSELWLGRERC